MSLKLSINWIELKKNLLKEARQSLWRLKKNLQNVENLTITEIPKAHLYKVNKIY